MLRYDYICSCMRSYVITYGHIYSRARETYMTKIKTSVGGWEASGVSKKSSGRTPALRSGGKNLFLKTETLRFSIEFLRLRF